MVSGNGVKLVERAGRRNYPNLVYLYFIHVGNCGGSKVYQKEHEHIRVYASKFEELHRFFKDTLIKEAVIGLFLNNVRKSLKVHVVEN